MRDVRRDSKDFGREVKRVENGAASHSPDTGGSNNRQVRAEPSVELQTKQFVVSERVIQEPLGTQDELRPGEQETNL
jgi:hypothetical protein